MIFELYGSNLEIIHDHWSNDLTSLIVLDDVTAGYDSQALMMSQAFMMSRV